MGVILHMMPKILDTIMSIAAYAMLIIIFT